MQMQETHTSQSCTGPNSCPDPLAHPELTDSWAIPRCKENRDDNATTRGGITDPAEYCVSAYCPRCQNLRIAREIPALVPNAWMEPETPE